jgi:protein-disulfide isomerase
VAGNKLFEGDLSALALGQFRQLAFHQYEQKTKALEQLIEQKLLEDEAHKRAVPVETLLEQDVDKRVPDPSEPEVRAYYLGLRDRLNRPFQEVKSELLAMLKKERIRAAREDYLEALLNRNNVKILLPPPRVVVGVDKARLRGNPTAPITIVEFSDFQCPFCQKSETTLKDILAIYKGMVNLSYRDFPLSDAHPLAELSAEASRCAGDQGKFWEFHDLLFENPNKLDEENLIEYAQNLKLDKPSFTSCIRGDKYKQQVERDAQDAARAGVTATPGFFIDGIYLGGAQPLTAFEKIIDDEVSRRALQQP